MQKATEKQKKLMKKLGISFDSQMSRSEAQMLIEEEHEMRNFEEDTLFNSFLDNDDIPLFDVSTSRFDGEY